MIVAIPCSAPTYESNIATRFARSKFFAIADTTGSSCRFIENPFHSAEQGAGTAIMGFLTGLGVELLVANELGLKVQQLACQKKIRMLLLPEQIVSLNHIIKLLKIEHCE